MKPLAAPVASLLLAFALTWAWQGAPARVQVPTAEDRLRILTDPEGLDPKGKAKDRTRPPREFFRSQVVPFDILPYVKPNHWCTLNLEVRSNYEDYEGVVQTRPIALVDMPQQVVFGREARLVKEQVSNLGFQMLLPQSVPKRPLDVELLQPGSVRLDELWQASLRALEPHQMLILVLTKGPNDQYAQWARYQCLVHSSAERADSSELERRKYYRLVLPLRVDKPLVPAHPLTWTTISHVIWDGMSPDVLAPAQQQALVDWLHWGGQLTVITGPGPSTSLLRDSFLGPYLPAEPAGENALLGESDLKPLADAYPPPALLDPDDPQPSPFTADDSRRLRRRYEPAEAIRPDAKRPVFLAGLRPLAGSSAIALGAARGRLLGVERRVGRGRVLMLAVSLTDPALAAWPGLDTLVRRVVLRRPEEVRLSYDPTGPLSPDRPTFAPLSGPDLSWVRYLGRDLGAQSAPRSPPAGGADEDDGGQPAPPLGRTPPAGFNALAARLPALPREPVAEWLDAAELPRLCRDLLDQASGISIPGSAFVLKVILAYIIVLVPINILICGYMLRRREWAWVVVPALGLAFAVGVERAAAYDLGFDLACDEIDLVEAYGGYPRALVSRFESLYSTGRVRFTVSYPGEPTALALPMASVRSVRGEDVDTSAWQSYPVPALRGFQVQPRSLAMFRAEQLSTLAGAIALETAGGPARVVNGSGLELRDAVLVDFRDPAAPHETSLGTIAPGATVEVPAAGRSSASVPATSGAVGAIDPGPLLKRLRSYQEPREEDRGEIRLVAWTPRPVGGQKLDPPVDRHRGLAVVVVHVRNGPPPAPDGDRYNKVVETWPSPLPAEVGAGQGLRRRPGPARPRGPARKLKRPR